MKTATALVILSLSVFSHAEIYTWVDENGKKHFGDAIPQKYQKQTKQVKVRVNTMELKKTIEGVRGHVPDYEAEQRAKREAKANKRYAAQQRQRMLEGRRKAAEQAHQHNLKQQRELGLQYARDRLLGVDPEAHTLKPKVVTPNR